jgi:hypothetical protein
MLKLSKENILNYVFTFVTGLIILYMRKIYKKFDTKGQYE